MRKVFTVWDSKTEAYLDPITVMNKGEALRVMQRLVDDPEHLFSKTPEDFTLFEIGSFDQFGGGLEVYPAKISIANMVELKKQSSIPARGMHPDPVEPIRSVN